VVTTPTLVALGLGLFCVVGGALGLGGRLLRIPSSTLVGNYTAQFLCGWAFLGAAVIAAFHGRSEAVSWVSVPTIAALGIAFYAFSVRPQRWIQPQWQQEMDAAAQRKRR
jgi:hypothetical protein